jgi:hypothetical protein
VDEAIEAYRRQLLAEADLSAQDLDEIEDHLRSSTDALRATGMPAVEAVSEAARRLGEPRELAREHARVRGAFGARLSWARRISVALCLAPSLWNLGHATYSFGATSAIGIVMVCEAALVAALLTGVSWARPLLLGVMGFVVAIFGLELLRMPQAHLHGWACLSALGDVGALVFLIPWRRGELSPAGVTLVLQGCVIAAALPSSVPLASVVAAVVATLGCILRARWSALAGATSTVIVAISLARTESQRSIYDERTLVEYAWIALAGIAILAAALATLRSWRSSRSLFGSLREITR